MVKRSGVGGRAERALARLALAGVLLARSGVAEAQTSAPPASSSAPLPSAPPPQPAPMQPAPVQPAPPPPAPPPYYAPAPPPYYAPAPPPYYAPSPPPYYAPSPSPPPTYYTPVPGRPVAPGPAAPPPVIYNWDPDVKAPAGYQVVDTPNGRLIGVGIGMLSSGWVTAMLIGAIASQVEGEGPGDDGVTSSDWIPMYFPVGGPIVTIFSARVRPSVMGLLILDSVVQTAGLLGIVLGATVRQHKLVRNDDVSSGIEVTPMVGAGFTGASLAGYF